MAYKHDMEGRIRIVENWNHCSGTYLVCEMRHKGHGDWGTDTAFRMEESEDGGGFFVSYRVIEKINAWQTLGVPFWIE